MAQLSQAELDFRNDLFVACKARMIAQELKGKTRDKAVIEYLIGATQVMAMTNHALYQNMMMMLSFCFCLRGAWDELNRFIDEHGAKVPSTKTEEAVI